MKVTMWLTGKFLHTEVVTHVNLKPPVNQIEGFSSHYFPITKIALSTSKKKVNTIKIIKD